MELSAQGEEHEMDPTMIESEMEECHKMLASDERRGMPYVMTIFGRRDWESGVAN